MPIKQPNSFIINNAKPSINTQVKLTQLEESLLSIGGSIDSAGNLKFNGRQLALEKIVATVNALWYASESNNLPKIKTFDISGCNLHGESFSFIVNFLKKKNTQIDTFIIRNNKTKSTGAQNIKKLIKMKSIKVLDFGANTIGDLGLRAITDVFSDTELHELYLYNNQIEKSAHDLAKVLKIPNQLRLLNLFENKLGDSGTIELSNALKSNSTLQTLDLGKNNISDNGLIELTKSLSENKTLKELYLAGNNHINSKGIFNIRQLLIKNNTLQKLDLSLCNINNDKLRDLSVGISNSSIMELNLSNNLINSEGIPHINLMFEKSKLLQVLNLSNNQIIPSSNNPLKIEISSLSKLILNGNNLKDNGASAIAKHLALGSKLKELSLMRNEIQGLGWSDLGSSISKSELQHLKLSYNKLNGEYFKFFINYISSSNTLESLNLNSCNIQDFGAIELSNLLKNNNFIRKINIQNNGIHDMGLMHLFKSLKQNETIKSINISKNIMHKSTAHELWNSLKTNHTLQYINIDDCDISNEGLIELIKDNSQKYKLFISMQGNKLTEDSSKLLRSFMESNPKFACDIERNNFSVETKNYVTFFSNKDRTSKWSFEEDKNIKSSLPSNEVNKLSSIVEDKNVNKVEVKKVEAKKVEAKKVEAKKEANKVEAKKIDTNIVENKNANKVVEVNNVEEKKLSNEIGKNQIINPINNNEMKPDEISIYINDQEVSNMNLHSIPIQEPPQYSSINNDISEIVSIYEKKIISLNSINLNLIEEFNKLKIQIKISKLIEDASQQARINAYKNKKYELIPVIDQLRSDLLVIISHLRNKEEISSLFNENQPCTLETILSYIWDLLFSSSENLFEFNQEYNVYTLLDNIQLQKEMELLGRILGNSLQLAFKINLRFSPLVYFVLIINRPPNNNQELFSIYDSMGYEYGSIILNDPKYSELIPGFQNKLLGNQFRISNLNSFSQGLINCLNQRWRTYIETISWKDLYSLLSNQY